MSENFSHAGAALFALMREIERVRAPLGLSLTPGRLSVLRLLVQSGPATASELARARGGSRQGIQRIANDLTRQGWIRRTPNPRHRRAALLEPTAAGHAVYRQLAGEETRSLNRLADGIPSAEIQAARRLLSSLRQRSPG